MPHPILYTVSIPNPHNHLVDVAITFSALSQETLHVSMPSWSPGSYLMREYGRHVQQFEATTSEGQPLSAAKGTKSTWVIQTQGASSVCVRYKVYAHELSVRHCHVDDSHAFLHGPAFLMYGEGLKARPCQLSIQAPEDNWTIFTTLPRAPKDEGKPSAGLFQTDDYDHLVDCPIEMGPHTSHTFTVRGVPHTIVLWGENRAPIERMLVEFPKFVEASAQMYGGLPYSSYLFICLHADKGYGGLEHRDSTALLYPGNAYNDDEGYESFLTLSSHEHFHVWNIKRIRPHVLGPFNYTEEAYTKALWQVEGFTSYYETIIVRRADLLTPKRFLELLGKRYGKLQQIPGRHILSLEQSSFDAWIKLYRPDESTRNTSVSYYLKGEIVACMLDLEIRSRTNGERSLDDLMLMLWSHYKEEGSGFIEDDLQANIEQIAGGSFQDFFDQYIRGTKPLDMNAALAKCGLTLVPKDHEEGKPWFGINTKTNGSRVEIDDVLTGSPAEQAGLYPKDEWVALNEQRITRENKSELIKLYKPGDTASVHLFRRGQLRKISVTFGELPVQCYDIIELDEVSDAQRALRRGWLAGEL